MKSADFAQQDLPLSPLTARAVLDAWRRITRAEIKTAFLFGCVVFLMHLYGGLDWILEHGLLMDLLLVIWIFLKSQSGVFALLLGVVVADRVTAGDIRRRAPYAVAVVVSAVIVTPMAVPLVWFFEPEFSWPFVARWTLTTFFEWLLVGGTAAFVYIDYRRAKSALARLRAAEIDRARTAKRTLESRLQAMQARVEPKFLLNTLAQVHDLYRADAARGERMLDELIAYLRAAMPKMRDTSSTVGQEIELARAYLGIVRLRVGQRLAVEIVAPDRIGDARMPPMMLLPLVDHAIAHISAEPQASGSIRVRAETANGKLRLEIAGSVSGSLPQNERDAIAGIRERLMGLYGDLGRLVVQRTGANASEAVLEVPYEPRADQHMDTDRGPESSEPR